MPTTTAPRARIRAAVSAASALAVIGASLLLVSPASAMATPSPMPVGGVFDDGEERGTPMSPGTAILVFVGIPLVVAAIIWLLVKAPGWTRSGRAGDAEAWTGDPLEVGGSADGAAPVAAVEAGGSAAAAAPDSGEETGGTSARW